MLRRDVLLKLVAGYLGCLVAITTAPLFFDSVTSSLLAIGPLMFEVLLAAYLVIRYLRLRGFLKLIAYFIAFESLVAVPSAILAPPALGQSSLSWSNNYVNPVTNNSTVHWPPSPPAPCVLEFGRTSTRDSTGYYGLGYGGASSESTGNCRGAAELAAQAYSSGLGARSIIRSSVWFVDQSFFVPDRGQRGTSLDVYGTVFVSGWLVNRGAGIGLYEGFTALDVVVKLVGNAPCSAYDCFSSYSVGKSWTGLQSLHSQYSLSASHFILAPGYTYNIVVSFNETSNTIAMGPSGVASADACFGYSSYCLTSSPNNFPGFPVSCAPSSTQTTPCGLELISLDYTLTNFQ